jgi:prepilin-type N-terminal cleavage/methylation domain-containing protein
MVRAFSLLEVTIALVVVGIVSAMAVPALSSAVESRRQDAIDEHVTAMVGSSRDIARTHLRCVTVAPIEACNGVGLTTWEHSCPPGAGLESGGTNPTLVDGNGNLIPDEATGFRLLEQFDMDPALVSEIQVLQPGPGCVGTQEQATPPTRCYESVSWFQFRSDGTAMRPFHIRILDSNGAARDFSVQPGSGSIRAVD